MRPGPRKHGYTDHRHPHGTPTYRSWQAMLGRCYQPSHPAFKRYHSRGIDVCDRWRGRDGFENFLADMGERPSDKTLDRINNDAGYFPANCRWATRREQSLNTSRVKLDEYERMQVLWLYDVRGYRQRELAEFFDVAQQTIGNIIRTERIRAAAT